MDNLLFLTTLLGIAATAYPVVERRLFRSYVAAEMRRHGRPAERRRQIRRDLYSMRRKTTLMTMLSEAFPQYRAFFRKASFTYELKWFQLLQQLYEARPKHLSNG